MDKKITKKMVAIIAVVVLLVLFIISVILDNVFSKVDEKIAELQASSTESTEEDEADTADTEPEEEKTMYNSGLTEEQYQEYVDAAKATLDGELDVSISDDEGAKQARIGSYTVSYNGSYADAGSMVSEEDGINVKMVVYDDGNSDDVKGYFIAYPFMENMEKPTTISQCQSILSELIPDGTGVNSEWAEGASFFVRKISGYSRDDSAAVIAYTFVPKSIGEGNIYQVVYTASKSGTTITPITEESFNSARDAIAAAVDDVDLFETDYEKTKEELNDIAFYETAETSSLGGVKELKDAYKSYLESVYGTTDVDSLSDEEIHDRYWKSTDPTGYAEYQYYENGIGTLNDDGTITLPDD